MFLLDYLDQIVNQKYLDYLEFLDLTLYIKFHLHPVLLVHVVVVVVDSKDKHTKKSNVSTSRASPIQPQHRASPTHAKRHVPRAMWNDTYVLPSPIEPRSSIHAQRRRRRRRRRYVVRS